MSEKTITERVLYADVLRLLSIIGVIVIHSCTLYLFDNNKTLPIWGVGLFYDTAFRWCIPVFFMLSGMFLLNPDAKFDLKTFLKKRLLTIVVPFSTWMIIYSIRAHDLSPNLTLMNLIKMNIEGPIYYHLWFVYTLIALYLLTPVLRIFIKYASRSELKYFLGVCFITMTLNSFLKDTLGIHFGLDLSYFSGFVGFFVLGYVLHKLELSTRILNYIYFSGVLGFLAVFLGTFITNSKTIFIVNNTFYSYLTPFLTVNAIAVFLFVKNHLNLFLANKLFNKTLQIKNLSRLIFGTYLIHVLILEILKSRYIGFDFGKYASYNFIIIPIFAVILFYLSFGSIYIINKLTAKFRVFKVLKIFY